MVRFKFLSCIGLLALMSLMAMPPGAMASDSLFIENETTLSLIGDGGSVLVNPSGGDVLAVAPVYDSVSGKKLDFTIDDFENDFLAADSKLIGGEPVDSSCSKPGHYHEYDI